jgi:hypothetical protein
VRVPARTQVKIPQTVNQGQCRIHKNAFEPPTTVRVACSRGENGIRQLRRLVFLLTLARGSIYNFNSRLRSLFVKPQEGPRSPKYDGSSQSHTVYSPVGWQSSGSRGHRYREMSRSRQAVGRRPLNRRVTWAGGDDGRWEPHTKPTAFERQPINESNGNRDPLPPVQFIKSYFLNCCSNQHTTWSHHSRAFAFGRRAEQGRLKGALKTKRSHSQHHQ